MMHYAASVRLFGSLDGFNTELPKWLHIDYAKKAYRASNKQNYVLQMTTWLRCQDSMFLMDSYLSWSCLMPSKCPIPCLQSPSSFIELDDRSSDEENSSEQVDETVRCPKEAPDASIFNQGLNGFTMLSRDRRYHLARSCPLPGIPITLVQEKHHAPLLCQALEQYLQVLHPHLRARQIWLVNQLDVYKYISILTPPCKHISATK